MGIYDFNILNLNDKANLVWNEGTFLLNRKQGNFGINLYSFSYFYVEVWMQNDPIQIEQIKTFKTTELLAPYLDNIKID